MRIASMPQLAQLGSRSARWRWIISIGVEGSRCRMCLRPRTSLEDFFAEVDKILKKEGVS